MNHLRLIIIAAFSLFGLTGILAEEDYKESEEYLSLREAVHHSFNEGDSARFFTAVKNFEDYLYKKGDLHNYYTQRCNEIVFLMNRQKIFEAYKMARQLFQDLSAEKLEKEMYMAYNMLGHIYRFCGNKEAAKRCFYDVLQRMENAGYRESMPPIYMNLVGVEMDENPEEAFRLIEEALEIARESSPERVFDIETRRTVSYYSMGDTLKFMEGYEAYKAGEAEGKSSVNGRALEVYYLALKGQLDKAAALAKEELGDESYSTLATIYKNAGRWKEAYENLKQEYEKNDSINSLLLSNSMRGLQLELRLYDAERRTARNRLIGLGAVTILLLCLIAAMSYIFMSRRRHMRQLKSAYEHALESDRMKSAFIQNVSHEVRTPLNVINGFAQVIADPDSMYSPEERRKMSKLIQKNTDAITTLIGQMLELSQNEAGGMAIREDEVQVNSLLRALLHEEDGNMNPNVDIRFDSSLPDDMTITTNKALLQRIVITLLDNAEKYTEQGYIALKASASDEELMLTVEDTGCGIPAEEAEHVFDRFVKLDTFKVGIGLGLSLCRTLTKRLGGNVHLDTTYTAGARFVVTLPR